MTAVIEVFWKAMMHGNHCEFRAGMSVCDAVLSV